MTLGKNTGEGQQLLDPCFNEFKSYLFYSYFGSQLSERAPDEFVLRRGLTSYGSHLLTRNTYAVYSFLRRYFETHNKTLSFFIIIPFSHSANGDISPLSNPVSRSSADLLVHYSAAVREELAYMFSSLPPDKRVGPVVIGGGDALTLSCAGLKAILESIRIRVTGSLSSVVVETTPYEVCRTVSRKKLALLRQYGVERISLRFHDFHSAILAVLGAGYTGEKVCRAIEIIRRHGFKYIDFDIRCVPEAYDSPRQINTTLAGIECYAPNSIRLYPVRYPFLPRIHKGAACQEEHGVLKELNTSLLEMGYRRTGVCYMKNEEEDPAEQNPLVKKMIVCGDWFSCGVYGCSLIGNRGFSNAKGVPAYMACIGHEKLPIVSFTEFGAEMNAAKYIIRSIVVSKHIDMKAFYSRFQIGFDTLFFESSRILLSSNILQRKDDRLVLTDDNLSSEICALNCLCHKLSTRQGGKPLYSHTAEPF